MGAAGATDWRNERQHQPALCSSSSSPRRRFVVSLSEIDAAQQIPLLPRTEQFVGQFRREIEVEIPDFVVEFDATRLVFVRDRTRSSNVIPWDTRCRPASGGNRHTSRRSYFLSQRVIIDLTGEENERASRRHNRTWAAASTLLYVTAHGRLARPDASTAIPHERSRLGHFGPWDRGGP